MLRNKEKSLKLRMNGFLLTRNWISRRKWLSLLGCHRNLQKKLEEEEIESGYVNRPQIIEHYMDMVDDKEESIGEIDPENSVQR